MDFLGVIQWVIEVKQYPDSHKEEVEKLKSECQSLSVLIKMVGEEELSDVIKSQIKRNLEEAETLLKNVPKKHNLIQSVLSMLPGQTTNVSKLKEASDNIHRTKNDLNTWLNARMYQSKNIPIDQTDLRFSKVKKTNSSEQETNIIMDNGSSKQINDKEVPATLVDQLDPTFEGQSDNGDDQDGLFEKKRIQISLTLDKTQNIYQLFEQYTLNTKEHFSSNQPGVFHSFQRTTYNNLTENYKDVNRISRIHAELELLEVESQLEQTPYVVSLQVPLTASERLIKKSLDQDRTASKEEDQFATCKEVISDKDGDEMFGNTTTQTPVKKQTKLFVAIACKGANGIFVYRKQENQEKQDEVVNQKLLKGIKQVDSGQWVKILNGEKALVFNNDSIAILKCEKITISYTIKIDE